MGVGRIDEFDEVFVACCGSLCSDTSACLCAELGEGGALDVAEVADGDCYFFFGVELCGVEVFACCKVYLCLAWIAPFVFDFAEFFFHDFLAELGVGEYLLEVGYEFLEFVELCVEFVLFQSCEGAEAHVDYLA